MAEVRLIDANALMEQLRLKLKGTKRFAYLSNREQGWDEAIKSVMSMVHDQHSTLDYAPVKHGEWTTIDSSYWRWKHDGPHQVMRFKYEHTECGKIVAKKEPYCPRCGAKMDGGAKQ